MAALPSSTLVTVEEYLNTAYDPDVEYIDGILVERNVGDWLHALVQMNIGVALKVKYPHLKVASELRSRTTDTRFRLPDISAVLARPADLRYLADPAYVVVEVLSPEDRIPRVLAKLREYQNKGVPNIWVVDPHERTMFVYQNYTLSEVLGDEICTQDGEVHLTRDEIFAE